MDDIFRMSENIENAQYGNDAIYHMINKKNLELNYDKSVYTIMGNKKAVSKMKQKLKESPLMIGEVVMKETSEVKYLGDFLTEDLSESLHKTLLKRIGIAKHSIYELRAVIEDIRSKRIGGINVGFQIFESAILSMLLYNSETWEKIPSKSIRILDNTIEISY